MKNRIIKRALFALLPLLILGGCNTEYFNPIPIAPVLININTNTTDITLNAQGSSKIFTTPRTVSEKTGFGGILVYHGIDAFYAYDLACPNEANAKTRVEVEDNGILAKCPVCGSKYEISMGLGNPVSGPSKYPLKTYSTTTNDGIIVTIYN